MIDKAFQEMLDTLAGIGASLGMSMNFEAVTARYVDVRLERRKKCWTPIMPPSPQPKQPDKQKAGRQKASREKQKRSAEIRR